MKNKSWKWSESGICKLLRGPFPPPAFIVLPQVRNGTGFQRRTTRTADALIVSTWPSRGLWIAGVEIKVSFSDWRRELADAAKSDMQQWCHHWWIAAPKGLIPHAEIPKTWGLIECTEANSSLTIPAPTLDAKPPDLLFLCSILRNVSENFTHKDLVRDEAASIAEKMSENSFVELKSLRENVAKFQKTSGIDLQDKPWWNERLGSAAKLVKDLGLLNGQDRLRKLHEEANAIASGCEKLLVQ